MFGTAIFCALSCEKQQIFRGKNSKKMRKFTYFLPIFAKFLQKNLEVREKTRKFAVLKLKNNSK